MAASTLPLLGAQPEQDPAILVQKYIKEFLDIISRQKWLIILFILLGIVVGGVMAWKKKDVYRSSTVILVEIQKIPEKYVSSVVSGSAVQRVSTITQQVLSRTNLQKMIDELHMSPAGINSQGYGPAIAVLRENITIETKGRRQLETITISFTHHDPMMAMKVASNLASQYINANIKMREQFIEGATEFLGTELEMAKQELDKKEKILSEYKLKYLGELPGQLDSNLRTLDRLQLEKTRSQEVLKGVEERMDQLKKTIQEYNAASASLGSGESALPQHQVANNRMDPLVRQVIELKRKLRGMLGEYTEAYPDIVSLKAQIQRLEQELAERPEVEGEIDPYPAELRKSLTELKKERATLKVQLGRITKSMREYEGRIERTPSREQEMLTLQRDYGNMRKNYQQIDQKRINARISENLDKRQKSERFRILDPANLPTKPEGFPREVIALGGFGGGLGLGLGLAVLLELLSPTFRRSEDVEVSLGFPMLATIPSFKMAYGKSMKMLQGTSESPVEANGKSKVNGSTNYIDAEMLGKNKSHFYRPSSKDQDFPKQLNLVSKWRPQSVVAEQFRVAATRLDLLGDRSMGNVALISSAMKGEGKTSTTANLAYTLARDLDEPTLIIDCDYKCPNLHNVFTLPTYPGVADYLAGEVPLESCFQQIQDLPLWVMPAGDMESNPVSLSKLQHLSSLIESVRSRYRFIILDCPPILPLADINVLSEFADILLMVVRSGVTPKDVVQKAKEMLHSSKPTRLILNDAWTQGVPYYVRAGYSAPYSLTSPG